MPRLTPPPPSKQSDRIVDIDNHPSIPVSHDNAALNPHSVQTHQKPSTPSKYSFRNAKVAGRIVNRTVSTKNRDMSVDLPTRSIPSVKVPNRTYSSKSLDSASALKPNSNPSVSISKPTLSSVKTSSLLPVPTKIISPALSRALSLTTHQHSSSVHTHELITQTEPTLYNEFKLIHDRVSEHDTRPRNVSTSSDTQYVTPYSEPLMLHNVSQHAIVSQSPQHQTNPSLTICPDVHLVIPDPKPMTNNLFEKNFDHSPVPQLNQYNRSSELPNSPDLQQQHVDLLSTSFSVPDSDYPSIDSSDPPTLLAKLRHLGNGADFLQPMDIPQFSRASHMARSVSELEEDGVIYNVAPNPADIAAHILHGSESMTLGDFFTRAVDFGKQHNVWLLPESQINALLAQGAANNSLNELTSAADLLVSIANIVPPQVPSRPETSPLVMLNPITLSRPLGLSSPTLLRPSPPRFTRTSPLPSSLLGSLPLLGSGKNHDEFDFHTAASSSPILGTKSFVSNASIHSSSLNGSSPSQSSHTGRNLQQGEDNGQHEPQAAFRSSKDAQTSVSNANIYSSKNNSRSSTFMSVQVYELETQVDELQGTVNDRDVQLRVQADTLVRLQAQLDRAQELLTKAEDRALDHINEVSKLRTELQSVSRTSAERFQELKETRRELDQRESLIDQLENDLATDRDANSHMRALLSKSNSRERDVSLDLQTLQTNLASAQVRIRALEDLVEVYEVKMANGESALNVALTRARDELELAHAHSRTQRDRIDSLMRTLDQLQQAQALVNSGPSTVSAHSTEHPTLSIENGDYRVPEPQSRSPVPSPQPLTPSCSSLASELSNVVGCNVNAKGTVTATSNGSFGSENDEVALMHATSQVYQADISITNMELIRAKEQIRVLELDLEQMNTRMDQVARMNSGDRAMWMSERAQLLELIESLQQGGGGPEPSSIKHGSRYVGALLVKTAVYVFVVLGGLVSILIKCISVLMNTELSRIQQVPLVTESGFQLYPSYVVTEGFVSVLINWVWPGGADSFPPLVS